MMTEFEDIRSALAKQLQTIDTEPDSVQKLSRAVFVTANAIDLLKDKIRTLRDLAIPDQVLIQKTVIPAVYGEYIYYAALHNLELNKPIGNSLKSYYAKQQDQLEQFFNVHKEFLAYLRSGRNDLDEIYFVNGTGKQPLLIDFYAPLNPDPFCTRWSFLAAQAAAYERLLNHIMQILSSLEGNPFSDAVPDLLWTATRTDMIELVYALFAAGVFNKGKANIAEVTRFVEKAFGLQLGNTSMTFQEILRRKQSIIFIEKLRTALDNYITNVEERQR